ncbi:DNA polymerase III beta subunit [Geitlerinema sp. FC II]|nr:DNA polymerase III beta subunit [Geitlerinema sp. FC II]
MQVSGDSIEIAFNVKYVMESPRNLQSTEIQMQLNTPVSPVILTPLGGTKTVSYTHLDVYKRQVLHRETNELLV